jgi:hypothetical protein
MNAGMMVWNGRLWLASVFGDLGSSEKAAPRSCSANQREGARKIRITE